MLHYKPNQTIYINNLNEKVKKTELQKALYSIFTQFGKVLEVIALKTLKMRGQAFIAFENIENAMKALNGMQGFPFYDKPMRIQFARVDSNVVAMMKGTYKPPEPKHKTTPLSNKNNHVSEMGNKKKKNMKKKKKDPKSELENLEQLLPPLPNTQPCLPPPPPIVLVELPPNKILFIKNLPMETQQSVIVMLFSQFPGYMEVRMVPGRPDIAFVEFKDEICSTAAKDALQGFKLLPTHSLFITFAKK